MSWKNIARLCSSLSAVIIRDDIVEKLQNSKSAAISENNWIKIRLEWLRLSLGFAKTYLSLMGNYTSFYLKAACSPPVFFILCNWKEELIQ